jgi:hypothetical protein
VFEVLCDSETAVSVFGRVSAVPEGVSVLEVLRRNVLRSGIFVV